MPVVSGDISSVKNTSVITVGKSNNDAGNDKRGSMPAISGGMNEGRSSSGVRHFGDVGCNLSGGMPGVTRDMSSVIIGGNS